jgi:hypothetical protein
MDNRDIEFLERFIRLCSFSESDLATINNIIDRLTLPDNLDELAKKLRDILVDGDFEDLAAYVAPHLATGLKPGDECRVKKDLKDDWHPSDIQPGKRTYVGFAAGSYWVLNSQESACFPYKICEKISKKQTHLIKLSEIIRKAESREFGRISGKDISANGLCYPITELIDVAGTVPDRPDDYPPQWLEER